MEFGMHFKVLVILVIPGNSGTVPYFFSFYIILITNFC